MYDGNHTRQSQKEIEREAAESLLRALEARQQAREGYHSNRRLRALGCVVFALVAIAVPVMLGFLLFLIFFPK